MAREQRIEIVQGATDLKPAVMPGPPPVPEAAVQPRREMPRPARFAIGIGGVLAVFLVWEVLTSYVAYTDGAYVRSDLVALSPQVTGQITSVAVSDNQTVRQGDLLVEIDPEPFQLAVDASQAQAREAGTAAQALQQSIDAARDRLAAANATLANAEATRRRAAALGRAGFSSREVQDNAITAARDAEADAAASRASVDKAMLMLAAQQAVIAQARAALASATWKLARTTLRAPVDGTVNNLNLRVGDTARADTPLIGIVAADGWRVVANYKQSYLSRLRPGATAWVWLDTHPWRFYRARIAGIGRGISRAEGDDGLLPYVAPTTDWIRLQHRFPVTIDLVDPPPGLTLYMGADARCVIFP